MFVAKDSPVGKIITFYSYKGDAGRTMTLANIACLLAQSCENNEKVLVIDWDLEAPSLHHFFNGRFVNSAHESVNLLGEQLGVIDLFYEMKTRLEIDASGYVSDSFFEELNIENYISKLNIPSLLLMPAGRFGDGKYSSRVNAFDWNYFFEKFPNVILQFSEYLRKKFKYTLIDSRTGDTDISRICTDLMPEKLVVIFTPNRQSLISSVELVRKSIEYRRQSENLRRLAVFPLASRVENAEDELQKEWRNDRKNGYQPLFESVMKEVYKLPSCELTNYFDDVQIQYKPRYTYVEEIAVLAERIEDRLSIARSYERFAVRLVSVENPWENIEPGRGFEYTKELGLGSHHPAFDVFLCHNSEDKPFVKDVGEALKKRGLKPWLDQWELQPGMPWQEYVEKQIDEIKSAAVFVGENGIGPWQNVEIRALLSEFVKRKCPVIPVILSTAHQQPELPLFLREMTWVDFRMADPDPMERLVWGITGRRK